MSGSEEHDSRPDQQDELLGSVLEGGAVNWSAAESTASTQAEQARVGALQDIARIVEFNRELQREESGGGPPPFAADAVRWGDLVLIEPLGSGSSGEVWRSWDERLHREVALKFLQSRGTDLGIESPLLAEARALARLRHPAVVVVYGIAEHDQRVGMWMELLRGETLASAIERGPMPQGEVARIGRELALALHAVHEAGLVHRDVKPANVVLEPGGRVVLTDFGLGRPRVAVSEMRRISGTPMFMAPELLGGEPASPRSDLYALGATLRWALTGKPPFAARTLAELHVEAAQGSAIDLRVERPHASAALIDAIERTMAPAPARRFASAMDLARALAGEPEGGSSRCALPIEPDSFVGRESDLERLEGRLEIGSRLVTLVGPGGMGKTRLAVRYGWQSLERWPGGVWFCDLTEARSLDGIASVVAGSLELPLGKDDPVAQLGHAIAARGRCLLILDNFEQVSELAGRTVVRWLERAPEARLLVTSRHALGVRGEDVHSVEPLHSKWGVELFLERVRGHVPGFDPGAESGAMAEVVRLSDGMPLAIELAAAWARTMTVAEMVERLRERLHALAGTEGGRHASLTAAIDGSWDLLRDWERAAWGQCAVFEGGFTLEAAEHVLDLSAWAEAPWVADVVRGLIEKSLLRTQMSRTESGAQLPETRLTMYASLQEYARTKLELDGAWAGGRGAAEARHGAWFARFGMPGKLDALHRHGGVRLWQRLQRDLDNLVAACRRAAARGDGAAGAAAYSAAWAVFEVQGPLGVAVELGRQVLREDRLGNRERAAVLAALGAAEGYVGVAEARDRLEAALALAREVEDRGLEARCLNSLGSVLFDQSRIEESRAHRELAIEAARTAGDRYVEATALNNLGIIHRDQGRMDEAIACGERALAVTRAAGDRRSEGIVLGTLGVLHHDQGRYDRARAHYEEALAIHREVGNRRHEAGIFTNLGTLNTDQGRYEEARVLMETALSIYREVGIRRSEGIALQNLGDSRAAEGRTEEAVALFEQALAVHRELGNLRLEGITLGSLGELEAKRGELDRARSQFEASIALLQSAGDPRFEGTMLTGLADVLLRQRASVAARDTLAAAEPKLRRVGARLELAQMLCVRAELDHEEGQASHARAALAEAESLAAALGVGSESELGGSIARVRRVLDVADTREPTSEQR